MPENNNNDNKTGEPEKICYICHRPESIAGKMIMIPNNINICNDCMQKTFDSMGSFGMGGFGMPPMNGNFPGYGSGYSTDNITATGTTSGNDVVDGDSSDAKNSSQSDGNKGNNFGNNNGNNGFSNISMINLNELLSGFSGFGMGNAQKVKQKKPKADGEPDITPIFDINNIPHPHEIKAKLDEYVVGQEHAKKVMSVAVYNHYKRVATNTMDEIEIEKSNMLMIGPTGSGKTYMVRTLAKLLDVPLAITDATSLTEAGYIGDDIESVVSKLLTAADNDVEKAEQGIIFIDEIDKLAKKKNTNQRDVSGESVQQGMLKLLEGADIEVPVGASSKNAMVPMTIVNTRNILFICGGAFPDLNEIVTERLTKNSTMGFASELRDKYDKDENLLDKVEVEDLKKFGLIPEFIGRLPIVFSLQALDEDMLVRILKEPKNAIIKQYQKLFELDEVKLEFNDEALHAIAVKAKKKELGARALRAIIEQFMLDIMYEIPKDDNIGQVTITAEYINGTGGPIIQMRDSAKLPMKDIIEHNKDTAKAVEDKDKGKETSDAKVESYKEV